MEWSISNKTDDIILLLTSKEDFAVLLSQVYLEILKL